MGRVLSMNGNAVTQAEDTEPRQSRRSYYAEDRTARYLLAEKDEHGTAAYFIRIGVTGLRQRVFGPFRIKSDAVVAYDVLMSRIVEAFIDVANDLHVEGHSNVGLMMIEPPATLTDTRP